MTEEPETKNKERSEQAGDGSERQPSPAGPHDEPALTNPDATPGAGSLPTEKATGDSDAGVG